MVERRKLKIKVGNLVSKESWKDLLILYLNNTHVVPFLNYKKLIFYFTSLYINSFTYVGPRAFINIGGIYPLEGRLYLRTKYTSLKYFKKELIHRLGVIDKNEDLLDSKFKELLEYVISKRRIQELFTSSEQAKVQKKIESSINERDPINLAFIFNDPDQKFQLAYKKLFIEKFTEFFLKNKIVPVQTMEKVFGVQRIDYGDIRATIELANEEDCNCWFSKLMKLLQLDGLEVPKDFLYPGHDERFVWQSIQPLLDTIGGKKEINNFLKPHKIDYILGYHINKNSRLKDTLLERIYCEDILWIESYNKIRRNTVLVRIDDLSHPGFIIYDRLKSIYDKLPRDIFLRISTSHIINKKKIERTGRQNNKEVIFVGEKRKPIVVTGKYLDQVKEELEF